MNTMETEQWQFKFSFAVELQWLERLWNHEHLFDTGVVQTNKYYIASDQEVS